MNRFFSFVSGALLGAVVGATLALLLTPTSGDDLLARIEDRTSYIREEVRKAAASRRAELESQLADLRKPRQA
jgi:gas vesicle protein